MVQQLRKSITTLAFLVSGATWAQAPTAPLAIKPDAPDRYIVVPGDTLWGISQRYTDSPWRWPDLWNMNKDQIRNPHLIYPGYVLILDRERGQLTIAQPGARESEPTTSDSGAPGSAPAPVSAPPSSSSSSASTSADPGLVKLSPHLRAESLARQGIPSIPASLIEPFLTRPLVIEPEGLDKAPTIVGTQTDRVIISAGNSAYVRGIGSSKEDTWYVYRRGRALVDPDTNQTLGYEAIYLGTAQVTRAGDPATIMLTTSVQEVGAGDKLVAASRPQAINYAPHAPQAKIRGRIMSIYGGGRVGEGGPQSIVTVNRGRADGVEVGHVLALYTKGGTVRDVSRQQSALDAKLQLPDERAGLAFVFRVFDRISYALVMHVTRPVSPLDVVQTP
ncbi:MAG TPA: LysM domain-containing protein [Burkholderiales bacterium]|nr:LysM domain-containing protein [Burkholderiales bacterium]